MPENLEFEGLSVSPNVIETIVRIASEQVEGVAHVGAGPISAAAALLKAKPVGVEIAIGTENDDDELSIVIHLTAAYGIKLQELGAAVQTAVADALGTQLGVARVQVAVYIDALDFGEQAGH